LEKELTEAMAQNLKLNDKIKELERRCSESTANMYDAKEKVKKKKLGETCFIEKLIIIYF
jgi:hypothetical protein